MAELDVGLVHHDHQRQAQQTLQVGRGQQAAIGVVGRAEEEQLGLGIAVGRVAVGRVAVCGVSRPGVSRPLPAIHRHRVQPAEIVVAAGRLRRGDALDGVHVDGEVGPPRHIDQASAVDGRAERRTCQRWAGSR
jgi:hypothetical protein